MQAKKRESDNRQHLGLTGNGSDGRIVNGYDVDKECMPRPWIIFIRLVHLPKTRKVKGFVYLAKAIVQLNGREKDEH